MITERKIKLRYLFFHPRAQEKSTGRIRNKYELLVFMISELDIYFLIWGTSNDYLKDDLDTLTVNESAWEYINTAYPKIKKTGYYSWKHISQINKAEILSCFKEHVATMKPEFFNELRSRNNSEESFVGLTDPKREKLKKIASYHGEKAIECAKRLDIV